MNPDRSTHSIDDFVSQWKRNRRFVQTIDREFIDWQITGVFYTALQAVNAAAHHLGERPTNHTQRNQLVQSNEAFAAVRDKYLLLYRLSRLARYDPSPETWLPQRFVTGQALVNEILLPIERQILRLIGRNLDLPPILMKD